MWPSTSLPCLTALSVTKQTSMTGQVDGRQWSSVRLEECLSILVSFSFRNLIDLYAIRVRVHPTATVLV
jgi:hypothetical protein